MSTIVPTAARPTLAVIIPNYNYARYVAQAIDSVLAQTPPADEIVVVDDGSTDNSMAVLAAYEGRVKVIRTQNSGSMAACTIAIGQTTADYIYCLDSDDYVLPGMVARVREAIATWPAKVQFQLHSIDGEGARLGSVFPIYPPGYDAAAAREDNARLGFYLCPTTSANVFRRQALEQVNLSSLGPRTAFDGVPALAMPYIGEIVSVNEPLGCYRIHGTGLSGWDKPTTALLQREIKRFHDRWAEVMPKLAMTEPPFAPSVPLYVREREMMIACNEGKLFVLPQVMRFLAGIPRTRMSPKQKAVLAAWSLTLLIPAQGMRDYSIKTKRSAVNRSQGMQRVLNMFLGTRKAAVQES